MGSFSNIELANRIQKASCIKPYLIDKETIKKDTFKTNWNSIYIVTLVAFIGAIHQNCIMIWPYLKLLDCTSTETFYGLLRSISSVGSVCSALAAGFLSNYLRDTKLPMIFGKIMALISCILYMSIETFPLASRKLGFFLFELLLGISVGAANIYRAHVAMASNENDRGRAVGICSLAPAVGLLVGPMIQLFFTILKYPGIPFILGTHINTFTAPILLTIIISTFAIYFLIFQFNGKMPDNVVKVKNIALDVARQEIIPVYIMEGVLTQQETKDASKEAARVELQAARVVKADPQNFDRIAVCVCLLTRAVINVSILNLITIGPPYIMMVFRWSATESVRYTSIILGLIGLHVICWNLAYVFLDLRKRFSERRVIVFALIVLIVVFIITYPWWFIGPTIAYQEPVIVNNVTINNQCSALILSPPRNAKQGAVEVFIATKNPKPLTVLEEVPLGCPPEYKWCATTHLVNMYIFLGSLVIALGVALPLGQINLDILFSKILGRIKQGTMQGVYIVSGDGLNIFLPIILSEVYRISGPAYIWQGMVFILSFCLTCWLFFYSRMISNTRRAYQIMNPK